jgi:hypothetical protein
MKKELTKEEYDQACEHSGNFPKKKTRQGWEKAAKEAHQNGDDKLMLDFFDDFERDEWVW